MVKVAKLHSQEKCIGSDKSGAAVKITVYIIFTISVK